MKLAIIGYGYAKAERKVSNHDLSELVETNHDWIVERTGIHSRYISVNQNTSDLACIAAQKAIEDAKINPKDIDLILVATMTPDAQMPSTANLVLAKLKLDHLNILAFDLNAACSGFIFGLQTASAYIESGLAKNVLVIGAEVVSKILDYSDRSTCVLFGDGAGAVIVRADQTKTMHHFSRSIIDTEDSLSTDPIPLNGTMQLNQEFKGYLRMKGQAVYRFAVKAVEDGINEILDKAKVSIDEIDWIIPHQANQRIILHVSNKMKIPMEKFYMNVAEFGNTSSASIPLALARMKEDGLLLPNQKILLVGFGAGLSFGSSYYES